MDLGAARVGVAVADELGEMAHARGLLPGSRDSTALLAKLRDLVAAEEVGRIVVGLPLDMKGGEGDAARNVRALAQRIADATGCEVEFWDERLSTVQARNQLAMSDVHGKKAKARIDEASAVVLLEAWLDARRLRRAANRAAKRDAARDGND